MLRPDRGASVALKFIGLAITVAVVAHLLPWQMRRMIFWYRSGKAYDLAFPMLLATVLAGLFGLYMLWRSRQEAPRFSVLALIVHDLLHTESDFGIGASLTSISAITILWLYKVI